MSQSTFLKPSRTRLLRVALLLMDRWAKEEEKERQSRGKLRQIFADAECKNLDR